MNHSYDKIDKDILLGMCRSVESTDDPQAMASTLTQMIVAGLEIKGCSIFILNRKTSQLEALASSGLSPKYLNKGPINADKDLAAAMKGEPILIKDAAQDGRLQYPQEAAEEGIGAVFSFPMHFSGDVIGILRLYHREPWDLSPHDEYMLLMLAGHLGLALLYARALNTLQAVGEALGDFCPA